MEVETHNFQQHTEVRWLSMGPSIKSSWEMVCHNKICYWTGQRPEEKAKKYQFQESIHDACH